MDNGNRRQRPVRWAVDGSGFVEVLSSDGETWYAITVTMDHSLCCECRGFQSHGHCYHVANAAEALETTLDPSTPGQLAFYDQSHDDPYRVDVRIERELSTALEDDVVEAELLFIQSRFDTQ